ncbi:MAG: winged helix-turn-helix transcriptional regulator [Bacilli bacterium]|nr:winged helix-turn-helix transcriptional regulator [Bacilli bacterium]
MSINIIDEIKELHYLLCNHLHEINKDNILSKYPSPLQVAIAFYLDNNRGQNIYQKNLQEEFHISKAAISDVVDSMEKKGILERIPSSIDGRRNRIVLTEFGSACFLKIKNTNEEFNQSILRDLSDEEIQCFLGIFDKIKHKMERDDVHD